VVSLSLILMKLGMSDVRARAIEYKVDLEYMLTRIINYAN